MPRSQCNKLDVENNTLQLIICNLRRSSGKPHPSEALKRSKNVLRDSSDPTKQSASLEWREMSTCIKALMLPFIHTCITHCMLHCKPDLLYRAFCKRRSGHTTGCQVVGRWERAQVHSTNCICLYWLGNRTVNSGWLDFILIFTTCLTWHLTMCLAPRSLSSTIYNVWRVFWLLIEIIYFSSVFVKHTHISQWRAKLYHNAYRYHIPLGFFPWEWTYLYYLLLPILPQPY